MNKKLNDLLNLSVENNAVKVKFNKRNLDGNDPLEDYLDNPDSVNRNWLSWRGKRNTFVVDQIAVGMVMLSPKLYLLTSIGKVTKNRRMEYGYAYEIEPLKDYEKLFGKIIVKTPTIGRVYCRRYGSIADKLVIHEILPNPYSRTTVEKPVS